jgi:hypothetical protein
MQDAQSESVWIAAGAGYFPRAPKVLFCRPPPVVAQRARPHHRMELLGSQSQLRSWRTPGRCHADQVLQAMASRRCSRDSTQAHFRNKHGDFRGGGLRGRPAWEKNE